MSITQKTWHKAFSGLCAQLEAAGAVVTAMDGSEEFSYIDEAKVAPRIVELYQGHLQLGYAKGWL